MITLRKALAAGLTGTATWGITAQPDGIDGAEWWGLFGVLVGAFLVWLVPNEPDPDTSLLERLRAGLPPDDNREDDGSAVDGC